jgi:uncharacterized membrane protein YcaP (DUF421 family)
METINQLFGLHADKLNTCQMAVRIVAVFFISLTYIRIIGLRALGKQNAFDQLTILIMGSILGRAVVSASQPFFPSLIAVLLLMALDKFLRWLTYRSRKLGNLFKGNPLILYEKGQFNVTNLRRTLTTKEDIEESLHLFLTEKDFSKMDSAYLERSGQVSITKKEN